MTASDSITFTDWRWDERRYGELLRVTSKARTGRRSLEIEGGMIVRASYPEVPVPLIVGLNGEESFIASDVAAILAHTNRVVFLEEGDVGLAFA